MINISKSKYTSFLTCPKQFWLNCFKPELAVKVTRGMRENALKSKFNGGNHTFGYIIDENKHFKPDPLAAPIVVEVFQKYAIR